MKRSPLHDAYRAYLDGKTSLDEVLELADRVLERFHGQPSADDPGRGQAGAPQTSGE